LQIQEAVELIDESLGEEEKTAEALTELADELTASRTPKDDDRAAAVAMQLNRRRWSEPHAPLRLFWRAGHLYCGRMLLWPR